MEEDDDDDDKYWQKQLKVVVPLKKQPSMKKNFLFLEIKAAKISFHGRGSERQSALEKGGAYPGSRPVKARVKTSMTREY